MQVFGYQKHILSLLCFLTIVVVGSFGDRCVACQQSEPAAYSVSDVLAFVTEHSRLETLEKTVLAEAVCQKFGLEKRRSVYVGPNIALRFSVVNSSKSESFSNVVLSLSALKKIDDRPFVVCVLRPSKIEFLLANSSLLKKISHSSRNLSMQRIRGSFLGHDIRRSVGELKNEPANFDKLFRLHQSVSWQENLQRLVDATKGIKGTGKQFSPTKRQLEKIHQSADVAADLFSNPEFERFQQRLEALVEELEPAILKAAEIDNVNLRGNRIEQLVTGGVNKHGVSDLSATIGDIEVAIEIKTKLMDKSSSPKGFNLDKALKFLGGGNTAIVYLFVVIDRENADVRMKVVSIFDKTIIDSSKIQHHWAGRNSRGATQLTGDFTEALLPEYKSEIDQTIAAGFLKRLLEK